MKLLRNILLSIGILWCEVGVAATCQDLLNAASQADANATRDVGTGAALLRQAAQRYRQAYNANCTGSRGSASPGGVGGSGAALNQIVGGIATIANILEQRRQREEAEAQEAALQAEMQRIKQETEDAQFKSSAEQAAQLARTNDDLNRQGVPNPWNIRDLSPECASSSNPSICDLLQKVQQARERPTPPAYSQRKALEDAAAIYSAAGMDAEADEATIAARSMRSAAPLVRGTSDSNAPRPAPPASSLENHLGQCWIGGQWVTPSGNACPAF